MIGVFIVFALAFAALLLQGLVKGRCIEVFNFGNRVPVLRSESPKRFWLNIVIYVIAIGFCVAGALLNPDLANLQ